MILGKVGKFPYHAEKKRTLREGLIVQVSPKGWIRVKFDIDGKSVYECYRLKGRGAE